LKKSQRNSEENYGENRLRQLLRLFYQETVEKEVIKEFVEELQACNPFFRRLSVFTCLHILKICEIVVFNSEVLYQKGEETPCALIILYGQIALFSKEVGVFYQTENGDTLCEENLLMEEKIRRYFIFHFL
jgi:hypothetical protein